MEKSDYKSALSLKLLGEVCSVIADTGYLGSAEEYVREYYGKSFQELTQCEAEMIVKNLGDKKGCLFEPIKEPDPFTEEAI